MSNLWGIGLATTAFAAFFLLVGYLAGRERHPKARKHSAPAVRRVWCEDLSELEI